ncbi:alpha/beta fold hydrolase [Phytomonospora endophytica]|uniref:Pimeloyl-ACP methyl ester carboxylesterase n=1 Tax=Phytomonospora endophytica TaxID=714109 RepID=A0A841FEU6_9ACTN|nr:alpha/beta fold hydrolase [Phytomonospora endophytica]MBB6034364.1 pimeloyl-ACP methyl ester carboxylesterase [Phytomonospora endophytica]GIG66757.1 alpha/beta hydrolase [Phytomonospora endophytica]
MAGSTALIPLDGGDVHVRQDGPPEAPAVLLVHGSASSVHSWDPLVPPLAEFHRVIRLDLLGHGRSAKPADGDYSIPAQALRAAAVLDRLGVERAVVVGHSTGGLVATALAENRPALVRALALVNTGPELAASTAPAIGIEAEQWPHLTDARLRGAMTSAFGRDDFRAPQIMVDDLRLLTFHAFTATLRAARDYLGERPIPERLTAVGRPLLVLFGEDDRRWRSSSAGAYRAVPGARVEMLPGVGHSPMIEDPPGTAALLLPYLAQHTGGTA